MKQTSNTQRPTLNIQLGRSSELSVERWALATAEPVHGEGGFDVGRFLFAKR